jgi:vitamin B12 transporter
MKQVFLTTSALSLTLSLPVAAQEIFDLGEIVVSATAEPVAAARTGQSVEVIGTDDLGIASGAQLSNQLALRPGISVNQDGGFGGASNLRIRGSSERFSSVYLDGIKVNDPTSTDAGFGAFGIFTTGGLQRIEVLKGSQSALWGGRAVAGVVNIETLPLRDAPEGIAQRFAYSYGSFETHSTEYTLSQRSGAVTVALSFSSVITDGFSAAEENLGNTEADGARSNRVSFGIAHEPTDGVRYGFNAFIEDASYEFDEFGFVPEDGTPGDETANRDARGLRFFAEIDRGLWRHDIAVSYLRVDRDLTSATTSAPFATPFASTFEGNRLRFDYSGSVDLMNTVRLTLGADAEEETATYQNLNAGSETITTYGVFAEAVYSPSSNLDVIGTVRLDDHSRFGSEVTGRLALSWRPSDRLTLRGTAATGYRPPSIDELFGFYPSPFGNFSGNPNLQPETSQSIELGADWALANGGAVSATVFRTNIDDLITITPTFDSLENRPGTATRQGLELAADLPISETMNLRAAYTYLDAKRADGTREPILAKHEFFLGVDAELANGWGMQANLRHVADIADDNFPVQALSDYTLIGLGVSYDLTDTAEAYLRIENLTDEQYQTSGGYGTADRAFFVGLRADF